MTYMDLHMESIGYIIYMFPNSFFRWKTENQHPCPKLNFDNGFRGNRLGQNVRNDRGSSPSTSPELDMVQGLANLSRVKPRGKFAS